MKNLKKISREDLKKVKGGSTPGVIPIGSPGPFPGCFQHMEQFLLDCNTDPDNEICRACN